MSVYNAFNSAVSLVISFFFLYGSLDHLDLHSFPTRRSSDLRQGPPARTGRRLGSRPLLVARSDGAYVEAAGRRSEEHTSELQSRPHLVCRLLLEKKNYNNISETLSDCLPVSCSNYSGQLVHY